MSTGQRQRVKLAQAIAADPSLVLLDEPTDGLDPVQRDEMLALIRQISEDFSIDVVLSSHLLEEVERICDNIIALDAGRLVAHGRLEDLVGDTAIVTVELVEVDDRPGAADAVEQHLLRAGLEVVSRDMTRLRVGGADPRTSLDAIRDAIASADARVRRISTDRTTLEDLFTGVSS